MAVQDHYYLSASRLIKKKGDIMSRKFTLASTGIALLLIIGSCEKITTPAPTQSDEFFGSGELQPSGSLVEGQYIIVLKEGNLSLGKSKAAVSGFAMSIMADNGVTEGTVELVYAHALTGFSARMSELDAAKLEADPRVEYIEQDKVITLTPPTGKGKPPKEDGGGEAPQETPWGITRVGGAVDGTGKTAWVIDTGIDLKHDDLNVDVSRSTNFVTRGKNSPNDGHGHGTHVAGTIAALDNAIDVVGVAAGATLVAVRVLDNRGSGFYSWVIAGVDYVAANASAGDVANVSLGGPPSTALDDAVSGAASKGILFALAAGNSGDDANNYSPGRVEHENVYTISAIGTPDDCLTSWSNYGTPIDFAAPGAGILSTKKGGGTTTMSGTSMSAPHVAGLLILGIVSSDGQVCLGSDPDGDVGRDTIAHN